MASVDGHGEIGLFGLGWHTGRRPGALHVDDDERQFGRYGQADTLGLERQARPGTGGHAERARV